MMWKPGDSIALRGIYGGRPCFVQSTLIVKDAPEEVALLIIPGAECAAPEGYLHRERGPSSRWERQGDMASGRWRMEKFAWHTNRFLILLEPEHYFATMHIWRHETGAFDWYYISYQLPCHRSHCGFDTLDLELDMVIDADLRWEWKDWDDYQRGIERGILRPEWVSGVEPAHEEVLDRIEKRL